MKNTDLLVVWVEEDTKKSWLQNYGRRDHVRELGVRGILLNQI
jgi:hypothetical protein